MISSHCWEYRLISHKVKRLRNSSSFTKNYFSTSALLKEGTGTWKAPTKSLKKNPKLEMEEFGIGKDDVFAFRIVTLVDNVELQIDRLIE